MLYRRRRGVGDVPGGRPRVLGRRLRVVHGNKEALGRARVNEDMYLWSSVSCRARVSVGLPACLCVCVAVSLVRLGIAMCLHHVLHSIKLFWSFLRKTLGGALRLPGESCASVAVAHGRMGDGGHKYSWKQIDGSAPGHQCFMPAVQAKQMECTAARAFR